MTKNELEDRLAENLLASNPRLFSDPDFTGLSVLARATWTAVIEVARKHDGVVPSDPVAFLSELHWFPPALIPECKDALADCFAELEDAGLLERRPA